jgi:hypothetical protein
VTLEIDAVAEDRRAFVEIGKGREKSAVPAGQPRAVIEVSMLKGDATLQAWIEGKARVGVKSVEIVPSGN